MVQAAYWGRQAAKGNHKSFATKGIDVRRDRPEPGDKVLVVGVIAH